MMAEGIITGLGAAFFQSLCYVMARHFVQVRGAGAGRMLLVLGHIWLGIFSVAMLPFVWPAAGLPVLSMIGPIVWMSVYYMLGQIFFVFALKRAEPSRASPLLGLKIAVLAILVCFFPRAHLRTDPPLQMGLNGMQWAAVALACAAAVALNFSGKRLSWRTLGLILLAVITFALSDWNIKRTIVAVQDALPPGSALRASLIAVAFCYIFCGLCAVAISPWWGTRSPRDWRNALPYSVSWLVAMILLYVCFALVGPLLGNILQSTRGLISILMGSLFAYLGHLHIESESSRGVFFRRLAAGVLMTGAVSLYVLGDYENSKMRVTRAGARTEKHAWAAHRSNILPAIDGMIC